MLRCMGPLGRRIKDHAYRALRRLLLLPTVVWRGSRPELPACCCCCTALIISAAEPAAAGSGPYGGDLGGLLELQQDLEWGVGGGGGGGGGAGESSQGFPVDTLMGWSCPWRRNRRAQYVRGGGRSCSVDCPGMGALQASRAYLRSLVSLSCSCSCCSLSCYSLFMSLLVSLPMFSLSVLSLCSLFSLCSL